MKKGAKAGISQACLAILSIQYTRLGYDWQDSPGDDVQVLAQGKGQHRLDIGDAPVFVIRPSIQVTVVLYR